jgi:PAS domain S-box-containing protein
MMLRLPLRIVLFFVLLSAAVLIVVGVLSYRSGSESLKTAATSEMLAVAIEKEAALDAWLDERLADIGLLSLEPDIVAKAAKFSATASGSADAHTAREALMEELEPTTMGATSEFTEVFLLDPENGKVTASTRPTEEGKSKAGRPYFEQGKSRLSLQPPYYSTDLAGPAITVAAPLRSHGRLVAVLAARLDLSTMNAILQRSTGRRDTMDSFIINSDQFVVTQPRFIRDSNVVRGKLGTEPVRLCAAQKSGINLAKDYRGVPCIAAYRWSAKHQLGLIAKIDQTEALAPVHAFGRSLLLISTAALLSAALIAMLLARTITRPLSILHDKVRRFAEANHVAPAPTGSGGEMQQLTREFEQMSARIAERNSALADSNSALLQEIVDRRRSEAERDRIFTLSLDLLCICGFDGMFKRVNPAFGKVLGFTVEELMARPFMEFVHPEDRAATMTEVQKLAQGARIADFELRSLCKDGNYRWVRWSATPINDEGIFYAYGRDVTDRKRDENTLRRTEELYRRAIAGADAVPYAYDYQTKTYQFMGEGIEKLIGYKPEEMKPALWEKIIVENIMSGETAGLDKAEAARRVVTGELRTWRCDMRVITRDGQTKWISDKSVQNLDEAGKPTGSMGILQDITDQKRTDESLRLLFCAIEHSADNVVITSREGAIQYANPAFLQLNGYTKEELLGQNPRLLKSGSHPVSFYRDLWNTVLAGNSFRGEFINRKKNGALYHEEKTVTPVRDAAGSITHFVATGRDISERKKHESKMDSLNRQLQETSRQAGMAEVASNVLHNVGNVLNSVNVSAAVLADKIKGSKISSVVKTAELLAEHASDLPGFFTADPRGNRLPAFLSNLGQHLVSEQQTLIREVELLTKNMEHIKEIIAMQQSYAKVSGVVETVSVTDLVEDALRMNSGAFSRHDVRVEKRFGDVPLISTEKHKVLQILVNLMRNAKYALDEGGKSEKVMQVAVERNGHGTVKISIIDNGVGIREENLTRIFAHGFTTRKAGHGFGLHSGALAAGELGGSLNAHSDGPGLGAAFTLELPAGRPENDL